MKCSYCGNQFKQVKFTEIKLKFISMHLCNRCFRNIFKRVFKTSDRYVYLKLKQEFCKTYKKLFRILRLIRD